MGVIQDSVNQMLNTFAQLRFLKVATKEAAIKQRIGSRMYNKGRALARSQGQVQPGAVQELNLSQKQPPQPQEAMESTAQRMQTQVDQNNLFMEYIKSFDKTSISVGKEEVLGKDLSGPLREKIYTEYAKKYYNEHPEGGKK